MILGYGDDREEREGKTPLLMSLPNTPFIHRDSIRTLGGLEASSRAFLDTVIRDIFVLDAALVSVSQDSWRCWAFPVYFMAVLLICAGERVQVSADLCRATLGSEAMRNGQEGFKMIAFII